MKILFWIGSFLPKVGGSVRIYYEIARRLPPEEVCILTQRCFHFDSKETEGWQDFDKKQKFKIYRIRRIRPQITKETNKILTFCRLIMVDFPIIIKDIFVFLYIALKEKINILCITDSPSYYGFLVLFNKFLLRKKTVFYLHGEELFSDTGSWLMNKMRFSYLSMADKLIAANSFTKNLLKEHGFENKTVLIYPGIDLEKAERKNKNNLKEKLKDILEGKKVLLTISRLEKHKGIDCVIKALPLILEKIPNLIYLIGGKGSEEEFLKKLTSDLNLNDRVRFLGFIQEDEIYDYYDLCDVFVLGNRETKSGMLDGLGMVFLEAGSLGKPVIGGRVGGVSEAILDGQTGILIDSNNINDVALSIIKLLQNPDYAAKLGENGKKRAQQFSWDETALQFKKTCDETLYGSTCATRRFTDLPVK